MRGGGEEGELTLGWWKGAVKGEKPRRRRQKPGDGREGGEGGKEQGWWIRKRGKSSRGKKQKGSGQRSVFMGSEANAREE